MPDADVAWRRLSSRYTGLSRRDRKYPAENACRTGPRRCPVHLFRRRAGSQPGRQNSQRSVVGPLRGDEDHAFLTEGGVFTGDLIETWLDYKRTAELDELRLRPHPHEFELYYDV